MRLSDIALIDQLAAEYALGTLRGGARRRFETLALQHPTVETAILNWHAQLTSFDKDEELPPSETWKSIERRLGWVAPDSMPLWERTGFWRVWALAGTFVAIALLAINIDRTVPPGAEEWRPLAVLQSPQRQLLVVLVSADSKTLWFSSSQWLVPPPGKRLEVWWIAPGHNPVSAGVLPDQHAGKIELKSKVAGAYAQYSALAISIEPSGGSPSGLPTGAVIFQGKLLNSI